MSDKESSAKKSELLQLRVEKAFLDHLSRVAEEKHMPVSVLIRTWLGEKLVEEERKRNGYKFEHIRRHVTIMELAPDDYMKAGPKLIVDAFPLSGDAKLSIEVLEKNALLLVPTYFSLHAKMTITQSGIDVEKTAANVGVVARGKGYRHGDLNTVLSISASDKQIFGRALDTEIVRAIRSVCAIYKNAKVDPPYFIKVSLVGVQDFALVEHKVIAFSHRLPSFTKNQITLSDIIIKEREQLNSVATTGEYIIEVLDELWNATGQKYSKSFDNEKRWINES